MVDTPAWAAGLTPYALPQFDRTMATLGGIQPQWQQTYADLIAKAASAGIPLVAVSGNRTPEEQDALYNSGRGVTRARGGQSYHNYGAAVDLVPASVLGAADWSPDDPVWGQLGEIVSQFPQFEWGGAWSHADPSHVQVRGGRGSAGGPGARGEVEQVPTMSAPAMAGLAPAAGGGQMASGLLGAAPAAPLRQGWLGGLLGVEPEEEGGGILNAILNPQNQSDRQGILQMAAAMLQASGPSTAPRSFGSSLGAGLQGYAQGQAFGAKQDERKLTAQARAQMEAMIAALPPEQQALARANPEQFAALLMERQFAGPPAPIHVGNTLVDPTNFQPLYTAPGQPAAPPAAIQEYEYARQQGFGGTFADWQAQSGGASTGPFEGTSVEAQSLNQLIASGAITQEQAAQLGAGKYVTGRDGQVLFLTPSDVVGGPPTVSVAPGTGAPTGDAAGPREVVPPTPVMTGEQANAAMYADRMFGAAEAIKQFGAAGLDAGEQIMSQVPLLGNYAVSGEFQQLQQAQRDFINALLRRESGAVISEGEFENARKQYFPQPGDSPEVLAQKQRNLETALAGMQRAAGVTYVPPGARAGTTPPAAPAAPLPPPTGTGLNTAPATAAPGGYPEPKSAAERDALAPGTVYRAPDGTLRTRGENGG
jgi:hypothetical protein